LGGLRALNFLVGCCAASPGLTLLRAPCERGGVADAQRLTVGVLGFGYWGPNLVRNFAACPRAQAAAICDPSPERRRAAAAQFPWIPVVADPAQLFADPALAAIVVATPLATHYQLARAALAAGKHVLVEKPLAPSAAECEALLAQAQAQGRVLMVDHTFVYTGAVRKIHELIEQGELGKILYFDSVRINLGLFQPDSNVLWDLAPHDLSIIDHILGAAPRWVSAIGASHYGTQENLAYLTIGYDDSLLAHLHLNWVAPVKTRRITIAGTRRMVVWDDTSPSEPVKVYASSVDIERIDRESAYQLNVQYRTGDVLVPKLDGREALSLVAATFARACLDGAPTPSDGQAGLRVVRLLEAAQRSMGERGARITL
jgi:predicted dehydrogenase